MASPYRELLTVPGARLFVTAGLVGRMSMSMVGIGIVLFVTAVTGSYGVAGAVTATLSVAFAVGAPLSARFADRYGQHRVLAPLAVANTVSFAALITVGQARLPLWTLFTAAAAAGLTQVSLGAWVRARWAHALRETPARMHTAYSFESVVDETIFIAGPMLVTVLSTGVHPAAGLVASATCTLSGSLALAGQRGTEPPPRPREPGGGDGVLRNTGLVVLTPVFLMLGMTFGSTDVTAVAFAEEQGHKALAGALIGCYALGSGVAALWYGARHWNAPLARRFQAGLVLLVAGLVGPVLVGDLYLMMFVVFFAGLAISPTIIPGFGLVERLVPAGALTQGLALVSTAIGVGVALGSSLAGRSVDWQGSRTTFLIPLGCAVAAALIGMVGLRTMRKHESSSRLLVAPEPAE
ncbi:MFS transporter [Actinomadura roseirufa]|uniref:MFS transporter n=1 Tax=Actinomadura roseirufa TaxID=2094049 RepID=UPI001A95584A|nr:MFS transporter [Actinomadura roseirufa]